MNDEIKEICNVLLVDDSLVIRKVISNTVEKHNNIRIVGEASNGIQAIEKAKELSPDIIILDVEMPLMNGIKALPLLLKESPRSKVIMLSTLTKKNASVAIEAMQLGASDYMEKPNPGDSLEIFEKMLIDMITSISESHKYNPAAIKSIVNESTDITKEEVINIIEDEDGEEFSLSPNKVYAKPDIIAFGSSTGGPPVLSYIIKNIKDEISKVPVVITQHIPKEFAPFLSETISRSSGVKCIIPENNEPLLPGNVYLAPGDYHMEIIKDSSASPIISLNQEPKEHFCRPSVNPMLRSINKVYGKRALIIMLTGMGDDGIEEAIECHKSGARIIAQDKLTSVVWGMPGAVVAAGICSDVLPKDDFPKKIIEILRGLS